MKEELIGELETVKEFFQRSTSCLSEEDSGFYPREGMLSVRQQVAHVAQTIDWFIDGMTSPKGFNMDFEGHWMRTNACETLGDARVWFSRSIEKAKDTISALSEEELQRPLPAGPVMGGEPAFSVISGITEHTAHHRGALAVYARLLGRKPKMPYMEL